MKNILLFLVNLVLLTAFLTNSVTAQEKHYELSKRKRTIMGNQAFRDGLHINLRDYNNDISYVIAKIDSQSVGIVVATTPYYLLSLRVQPDQRTFDVMGKEADPFTTNHDGTRASYYSFKWISPELAAKLKEVIAKEVAFKGEKYRLNLPSIKKIKAKKKSN